MFLTMIHISPSVSGVELMAISYTCNFGLPTSKFRMRNNLYHNRCHVDYVSKHNLIQICSCSKLNIHITTSAGSFVLIPFKGEALQNSLNSIVTLKHPTSKLELSILKRNRIYWIKENDSIRLRKMGSQNIKLNLKTSAFKNQNICFQNRISKYLLSKHHSSYVYISSSFHLRRSGSLLKSLVICCSWRRTNLKVTSGLQLFQKTLALSTPTVNNINM